MIVRHTNSRRVSPCSAREPLPSTSTGDGRGNHTLGTPKPRPVGAKLLDHLGNQVAKRGRVVLIDIGRSGFAAPYQHFSFFHEPLNSQGARHDLA